ncbi:uncharacterized protein BJ171DRAFT_624927 [Polychytrium aggregatum]|uniref:uncharacterized protein n=1 Tax=Polychytrium aggregatum TaxID=110093 RepID=UPI0022FE77BB|nr:uncharacterized protein BJ171DRAFT_624927 [Polychytrium aggregatum]KAI9203154.1 hypothetical protein BJ171DRAFT_624927 [Polychytrium aggregatum]
MFVDLGAHFGDAVRNFLGRCKTESECQLQEPVQIPWFIAREDFVIYMFEADHRFTPDLQNLTAELAESEPPIKVWLRDATAVHNQDGDIDLFVDEWSHDNAYWASSIRPWDGWAIRSDPAVPVRKVQAIDFARWLELTARPDDYVVVNLDLEGAEFVILPHLWESRAFRLIDSLLVHWHDNHNGFSPAEKDAAKMAVVNMIKAGVHIPYF